MKTFQDLEKLASDRERGEFCKSAVNAFRSSSEYKQAKDGEAYYSKHNITIEAYKKMLTTLSGRTVEDIFSSNYKLKTLFFRRLVSQQVNYVINKGVNTSDIKNKEKLGGRHFDKQLKTAAARAMAEGRAFGFWNYDHLEVFGYADTPTEPGFCPLYDEKTGEMAAGIRYWFKNVGDNVVFRATLYEKDGYTEYTQSDNGNIEVLEDKRGYKNIVTRLGDGTIEDVTYENYGTLPIVPLYANDTHESELVGVRECIDCYDFVKSGLANDIDDTSGFYWILKNTGGMEDTDLAKFIQRMKQVRGAVVDGNEGVSVEAHTLDVPVTARTEMLRILRADIYEDFQALDVSTLSAAQKTTQEIQAAYQSQDNKCADFEYYLLDFVEKIMQIAGIDDTPSFIWNRVVNMKEQTDMLIGASGYLTDEVLIRHLPFLSPDEVEECINGRDGENYNLFNEGE